MKLNLSREQVRVLLEAYETLTSDLTWRAAQWENAYNFAKADLEAALAEVADLTRIIAEYEGQFPDE